MENKEQCFQMFKLMAFGVFFNKVGTGSQSTTEFMTE